MVVRAKVAGIDSPEALAHALTSAFYLADDGLATAAYLALALGKPLLLEGAPGVGKTEAAKAISGGLGRRLIRLQCYEGIDAAAALYEWNYPRQMLAIRQAGDKPVDIYRDEFLIERPMLQALRSPDSAVLLLDEIQRRSARPRSSCCAPRCHHHGGRRMMRRALPPAAAPFFAFASVLRANGFTAALEEITAFLAAM